MNTVYDLSWVERLVGDRWVPLDCLPHDEAQEMAKRIDSTGRTVRVAPVKAVDRDKGER